jgi:hypothetical protein
MWPANPRNVPPVVPDDMDDPCRFREALIRKGAG